MPAEGVESEPSSNPHRPSQASSPDLEANIDSRDDAASSPTPISSNQCTNEKQAISRTDWTSPDDPDNPHNWPTWRKMHVVVCVAGLSLTAAFGSSAISAGLDVIAQDLETSVELARLAFSIYILGMAIGAVFTAPFSEAYGRRVAYWTSFPIFAPFIMGSGLSQNIASLVICRLFAGVFASVALSIGSSVLADIFLPAQRAVAMSIYVATPFFGPALGPLIGGFVVTDESWRWTCWVVLFMFALFFPLCLFLGETYKPIILARRAKRHGLVDDGTAEEKRGLLEVVRTILQKSLFRPIHMLSTEPVVAALSLWVSFTFALLYGFFTSLPLVWQEYYGFSVSQTGLTFLGVGTGVLLGFLYLVFPDRMNYRRVVARLKKRHGPDYKPAPEHRLYAAMVAALLLPPSLFVYGWTAQYQVFWLVPVICEAIYGFGMFLIFMSAVMYIMDFYGPMYGASAIAANTLLRYTVGFAFPLFSGQMYNGLGVGWASSLLGFCSVVLTTIPFVLHRYGAGLRKRSGYRRPQD